MKFKGFTEEGILFLKNLAANNNKEWFEEHRKVYERTLLNPLKDLTSDLEMVIKSIDTEIVTTPAINKTISKIYRDTRYSNDKSPFRTMQWISFKRQAKIYGNVPEFYFYFTPEKFEYGMGFYSATSQNMARIREAILSDTGSFKTIIDAFATQDNFKLEGESYKKPISNPLPEEFQQWFQKKNLCLSCENAMNHSFFSAQLKDVLEKAFSDNAAFYRFLMEAVL